MEDTKRTIPAAIMLYFSMAAICLAKENITYRVRVVDIKGQPVVGAEVAALETIYDWANGKACRELLEKKVTGQDGIVLLNLISSGHELHIVSRKNSLAFGWDTFHQLSIPLDGSEHTILLDKPCVLSGKVLDEAGMAVAGAKVHAEFASEYPENVFNTDAPEEWFTSITDAQGIFKFDNIPPDATADFLITAPGKAGIWTIADLAAGSRYAAGRTDIRIVLSDEAIIKGRVEDHAGKPVGGIKLLARPDKKIANYYCVNRAVSEKDGSFVFKNVLADTYSLQVVAPLGKMAEWVARDIRVVAKKGQTSESVIVKVHKGGFIDFVVRNAATNQPVSGVYVSARQQANFGKQPCFINSIKTDSTGRAHIRASLGKCNISAGSIEYSYFQDEVVVTKRPRQLSILLEHHPQFSGTVRNQEGESIAGATVSIVPPGHTVVVTDQLGKFRISTRIQSMQKYLLAKDLQRNLACLVEVKEQSRPVNIVLKPALTLTGRVTDPNGIPIPITRIQLVIDVPDWAAYVGQEVITDKEGKYVIPAVPQWHKDIYSLNVNAAGYCPLQFEKVSLEKASANQVKIKPFVVQPLNMSISGVVVDTNGKPVPDKVVHLSGPFGGPGQPWRHTITNENGEFYFNRICKGPLNLQAGWASDNDKAFLDAYAGDKDVKIVLGR